MASKEELVKSYNSKKIVTIEDFMEAIRMTVGQYLGYTGSKGWLNAIREIVQNMLDEQNDPESFCDCGWVHFDEMTQEIDVTDNGRGIPFDSMRRVYCDPHTSKNYNKEKYNYSAGRHGIGAKATNAVSSFFEVESYRLGKGHYVKFQNGTPIEEKDIPAQSNAQGTRVYCVPHPVMEGPTLSCIDVLDLICTLVPLSKVGAKVIFEGVTKEGKIINQTIVNQDGLLTYLVHKTTNPLFAPITMCVDTGEIRAECAFTYDASDLSGEPDIISFANYCPTVGGTHVDGFLDGLCNYFKNYMNKVYLKDYDAGKKKKKEPLKITNNDIRTGLKAAVHGLTLYPTFTGQAKEVLSNVEVGQFFKEQIPLVLDAWTKANPKDFNKLTKFFKDVAEAREYADKNKAKLVAKYEVSNFNNMPAKYLKPNGDWNKYDWELIIAEGDSAIGTYKNSRNAMCQGLFPIRGKIINAITNVDRRIFENEEIQALIKIIFGTNEIPKKIDVTKIRWKKIIIATDADMDGYHIRTLLMKFFITFMPELILNKIIYIAIPPLYGLKTKDGMQYFTDEKEYLTYVKQSFIKKYDWKYNNGKRIGEADMIKILMDNNDYASEMRKLTYAYDPVFLEAVLLYRNLPINEMKKAIKKRFRFLESIVHDGNAIVIRALVNQVYQTVFLNERFLNRCSKLIKIIDNSFDTFLLNGELVTLYGVMSVFDSFKPPIYRYKGLGEMNEDQLAESTLYPSETRRLMVYTTENLEKDIEKIRYLESNKQLLLKDVMR